MVQMKVREQETVNNTIQSRYKTISYSDKTIQKWIQHYSPYICLENIPYRHSLYITLLYSVYSSNTSLL